MEMYDKRQLQNKIYTYYIMSSHVSKIKCNDIRINALIQIEVYILVDPFEFEAGLKTCLMG